MSVWVHVRVCASVCICVLFFLLDIGCAVLTLLAALCTPTKQHDGICNWLALYEKRVVGELLEASVPRSSCDKVLDAFDEGLDEGLAMKFINDRKTASAALLELLKHSGPVAADGKSQLPAKLAELRSALEEQCSNGPPSVPGVAVIFRDGFKAALGDVFGGILSRTVEPAEESGGGEEVKQKEEGAGG